MAGRGNPKPTGSKPDKLMRDALMVALNREAKDANGQPTKRLYIIAEKLASKAESGDPDALSAIREVFDRVDGKPAQSIGLGQASDLEPLEAIVRPPMTRAEWLKLHG